VFEFPFFSLFPLQRKQFAMRDLTEFTAKKNGAAAAKVWIKQAALQDLIDLAASQFEYGEPHSIIDAV
jgi:hypothetical protein